MNWIQAYINAVKAELPASSREDIGTELQSLLEESLESQTGKTPDEMSEEEMVAWLKTREHPALVAGRYQERRSLVSEDVFPLFKLTLRYVLIGLVVAYAALAFVKGLSSGGQGNFISVTDLASSILHSGLTAFAVVTLIFHFWGSYFNAGERLANWNPKELPDPQRKWEQEPRSSSIAGLVFTGLFLLALNGFLVGIYNGFREGESGPLNFQAVEAAVELLPWMNLVLIGSILLYAVMIVRPLWSATTLVANIVLSLATAVIVYQLQGVSPLFELELGSEEGVGNMEGAKRILGMVNTSLRVALLIVLLVSLWEAGRDVWRIAKLGARRLY